MRSVDMETRVQAGALADAWNLGNAIYWGRRAAAFTAAAPRAGDFIGQATHDDLRAAAERCAAVARACRSHGALVEHRGAELADAVRALAA